MLHKYLQWTQKKLRHAFNIFQKNVWLTRIKLIGINKCIKSILYVWLTNISCYKSTPLGIYNGCQDKWYTDINRCEIEFITKIVNHERISQGEGFKFLKEWSKSKAERVPWILVVTWIWSRGRAHMLPGVCQGGHHWVHRMNGSQTLSYLGCPCRATANRLEQLKWWQVKHKKMESNSIL